MDDGKEEGEKAKSTVEEALKRYYYYFPCVASWEKGKRNVTSWRFLIQFSQKFIIIDHSAPWRCCKLAPFYLDLIKFCVQIAVNNRELQMVFDSTFTYIYRGEKEERRNLIYWQIKLEFWVLRPLRCPPSSECICTNLLFFPSSFPLVFYTKRTRKNTMDTFSPKNKMSLEGKWNWRKSLWHYMQPTKWKSVWYPKFIGLLVNFAIMSLLAHIQPFLKRIKGKWC